MKMGICEVLVLVASHEIYVTQLQHNFRNATKELLDEKDEETLKNVPSDDDEGAEKIEKCFVDEKRRERWDCESILCKNPR